MRGARARRGARVSGRMRACLATHIYTTLSPGTMLSRHARREAPLSHCRPSVSLERASVAFAVPTTYPCLLRMCSLSGGHVAHGAVPQQAIII
jgi:hypothetical protein